RLPEDPQYPHAVFGGREGCGRRGRLEQGHGKLALARHVKRGSCRIACAMRGEGTPVRAASADTNNKSKRRSTMKKIITTAAIAACGSFALAGAAYAQGSVAVYGLLDAAVDYNTNVDSAG